MTDDSVEPTPENRLRYDEAVRAIDTERARMDALQTRAGLLLATLAISAGELGGRAADRPGNPFPVAQIVAWVALIVCAAALLYVIWSNNVRSTYRVDPLTGKTADQLLQDITNDLSTRRRRMTAAMAKRLCWALRIAIVAMSVNVAAWTSIVIWR